MNGSWIALFVLVLMGCDSLPTDAGGDGAGIMGRWSWMSTSGGIAGTTTSPVNGNVHVLTITPDSGFIESRNDTTTFSDRFTARYVTVDGSVQRFLLIDFIASKRFSLFVVKADEDSLVLSDMLMDGYTSIYRRKR